ncbi:MAG TPA: TIGR02449 family protein [Crenotrichaceae bacterium]|nr:TIGR02449 family protein [Crenotrichaceae bacterium]
MKSPSQQIDQLEQKVDALIARIWTMDEENRSLRSRNDELIKERSQLIEKTTLAKTRVEAMITRLKGINHQ